MVATTAQRRNMAANARTVAGDLLGSPIDPRLLGLADDIGMGKRGLTQIVGILQQGYAREASAEASSAMAGGERF